MAEFPGIPGKAEGSSGLCVRCSGTYAGARSPRDPGRNMQILAWISYRWGLLAAADMCAVASPSLITLRFEDDAAERSFVADSFSKLRSTHAALLLVALCVAVVRLAMATGSAKALAWVGLVCDALQLVARVVVGLLAGDDRACEQRLGSRCFLVLFVGHVTAMSNRAAAAAAADATEVRLLEGLAHVAALHLWAVPAELRMLFTAGLVPALSVKFVLPSVVLCHGIEWALRYIHHLEGRGPAPPPPPSPAGTQPTRTEMEEQLRQLNLGADELRQRRGDRGEGESGTSGTPGTSTCAVGEARHQQVYLEQEEELHKLRAAAALQQSICQEQQAELSIARAQRAADIDCMRQQKDQCDGQEDEIRQAKVQKSRDDECVCQHVETARQHRQQYDEQREWLRQAREQARVDANCIADQKEMARQQRQRCNDQGDELRHARKQKVRDDECMAEQNRQRAADVQTMRRLREQAATDLECIRQHEQGCEEQRDELRQARKQKVRDDECMKQQEEQCCASQHRVGQLLTQKDQDKEALRQAAQDCAANRLELRKQKEYAALGIHVPDWQIGPIPLFAHASAQPAPLTCLRAMPEQPVRRAGEGLPRQADQVR